MLLEVIDMIKSSLDSGWNFDVRAALCYLGNVNTWPRQLPHNAKGLRLNLSTKTTFTARCVKDLMGYPTANEPFLAGLPHGLS